MKRGPKSVAGGDVTLTTLVVAIFVNQTYFWAAQANCHSPASRISSRREVNRRHAGL